MDCENHESKCFNRRLGEIYEQIDELLNDSLSEAASCGCKESCVDEYGCCCCECNYMNDEYDDEIYSRDTEIDYCMDPACGCLPDDCELCADGHDDTLINIDNDVFMFKIDEKYFADKLTDIVNNLLKDLAAIDKSIKDTKDLINYEAIYESIPPKVKNFKNKAVDSMPSVYDTKDYLEDAYKKAMKNIKKNSKLAK